MSTCALWLGNFWVSLDTTNSLSTFLSASGYARNSVPSIPMTRAMQSRTSALRPTPSNKCSTLGNGVCNGTSKLENHWAYSIPFALQWFWIAVIIPGMFFVPESPWWLVRKGRMEDAEASLRRLASSKVNVTATLAFIVETDRLEQELEAGSTYMDCFKKVNLRRTEISIGVYCAQVLSGIYLINYGTYFFQQAGLPTDEAFNMAVGFLGTFPLSYPTTAPIPQPSNSNLTTARLRALSHCQRDFHIIGI